MSRNPQSNYSFQSVAATMGGRFGGQYITNDTVETYGLPWGSVSTVRFLPIRRPADPARPGSQWTPFRLSQDVNAVGDWVRCYYGVRNFGAGPDGGGVSFLINDPTDPTAPPKEESPAYVLYNAVHRAIAAKQEGRGWASLTIGGQNRGAALAKPKPVYMAQVLVMQHKDQVYQPPKGWSSTEKPQLLIMSDSAGQALMNLANGINEGVDPHDTDWTRVCRNGDLVGLSPGQGQYVTFYKSSEGDPRLRRVQHGQQSGGPQLANWGAAAPQQGGGGGSGFASYQAFAEPAFMGQSADLSHFAEQLAQRSIQWDQILNFPSYEQQAMWIADKFQPDVICYAFQDFPEWIPPRVRDAAAARTMQAGHMAPAAGYVTGYQMPTAAPTQAAWGTPAPVQAQTQAPVQYAQTEQPQQVQQFQQPQQPQQFQQPQQVQQPQQLQQAPTGGVPFLVDALTQPNTPVAPTQPVQPTAPVAPVQPVTAPTQPHQVAQPNWNAVPPVSNGAVAQPASAMAGMAAGGIPVAVTQAPVSNMAQQPAAGYAMPTQQPQQPTQPVMTRAQAALAMAQQAAAQAR